MCLTHSHCRGFILIVLLAGMSPHPTPQSNRSPFPPLVWGLSTSQEAPSTLSSAPCFTLFSSIACTATSIDIGNLCSMSLSPRQNARPARVSYRTWHTAHTQYMLTDSNRVTVPTPTCLLLPWTARQVPSLPQSFFLSAEGSLEPQIEDLINRINELQQGKVWDLRWPAGQEGPGL